MPHYPVQLFLELDGQGRIGLTRIENRQICDVAQGRLYKADREEASQIGWRRRNGDGQTSGSLGFNQMKLQQLHTVLQSLQERVEAGLAMSDFQEHFALALLHSADHLLCLVVLVLQRTVLALFKSTNKIYSFKTIQNIFKTTNVPKYLSLGQDGLIGSNLLLDT